MSLIFQNSPWWVAVCLLAGAVYAVAMYQPLPGKGVPGGWGLSLNRGLAAFTAVERKSESVTLTLERASAAAALAPVPPSAAAGRTPAGALPRAGSPPPLKPPSPPKSDEGTSGAPQPSSGSFRRTLGFVGLGVGGAGLILGAVTGGLAIPKHNALDKTCPDGL